MPDVLPLDPSPPAGLAPATGPLPGALRAVLDRLQRLTFRAVQLDARSPELRPSSLSGSGRRDVLATLRRRELRLVGLDCLVPPSELVDPSTADAAVAAVIEVIRLAADLGRVPVSMRLPVVPASPPMAGGASGASTSSPSATSGRGPQLVTGGDVALHAAVVAMTPSASGAGRAAGSEARPVDAAIIAGLEASADRHGVPLVDHAVPIRQASGPLVPGLDVAACLTAGVDPMVALALAGDRLGAVRLSDLTDDGRRVPLGHAEGRLALEGFAAAVAAGDPGMPLVLDVRQCGDAWAALVAGAQAWTEVFP